MKPPYSTKQDFVYQTLRASIQTGELRPGAWLSPQAIAEEMGVSAIPVREALKQLARDRLVDIQPHRRAVVTTITPDEALWIAEMRTVLEPLAAEAGARAAGPDLADRLDAIVVGIDEANASDDVEAYAELNRSFHASIYASCENRRLVATIDELWMDAQRFRTVYRVPGHRTDAQASHRSIVSAVRRGDSVAVGDETRRHRERIAARLRTWLASEGAEAMAEAATSA